MTKSRLTLICLCLLPFALQTDSISAQPPGFGGRGGFGGPGGARGMGGLLDLLRDEEITTTLGVTAEQLEQVDAIREEARTEMEGQDFRALFEQAETDEDRAALMEELRLAGEARTTRMEEQLQGVLDEAQFKRLREVYLQRSGLAALTRPDVVAELGISDDQMIELQAIQQERGTARMELGFRASEEDQAAFNQEWDSRVLVVLSEEQRDQWQAAQGEPFVAVVPEATPTTPAATVQAPVATPTQGGRPYALPPATNSFGDRSEGNEPMLTFSFNDAPWEQVLRRLAEISGFTLDLTAQPPGSFTYYDPNSYTPTEARDVINGYLAQRGYLLFLRNNALVCASLDNPPPNLIPRVALADLPNYGLHDMVSVVIPAPGVEVEDLASQLEGLRGPQGKIVGLDATNTIVVTDLAFIVAQLAEVVEQVAGGPEDIVFKAIRLEHISAAVAEPTVKELLGISDSVTNVSASAPQGWGGWGGGDGRGRGGDDNNRGWQPPAVTEQPQVTIDMRTNSLLVAGTPADVRIVESALEIIDVQADENPFGTGPTEPYLVVYTVQDADASEVAKTINAMMPNTVINEDGRNGRIHIMANQAQHQEISTLIRQLDGMGGASSVAVIRLSRMDPLSAVSMLNSMFIGDGVNAPTIEGDVYGRQVLLRGSQEQIAQARTILLEMGEDGTGERRTGGTMQSFPLSGRDPQELLELVESMWSTTPVTIINPEERQQGERIQFFGRQENGEIETGEERPPLEEAGIPRDYLLEDRVPGGESVVEPPVPAAANPVESTRPRAQRHPLETEAPQSTFLLTSLDDGTAAQGEVGEPTNEVPAVSDDAAAPGDPEAVDLSEVRITVVGGEIIVEHPDPEVVDQMMALLEQVIQTLPPRSSWKIFPLQVADATTVATLLQTVIPEATVIKNTTTTSSSSLLGGLTSGFSGLGTSVMSMTGLDSMGAGSMSLQIIPETTHNALIVTGPQYLIEEVIVWLNILDSPDWPDNYRNREPKMIPVLYADSQDVFNILQQTYADMLENEQNRQGRQAQEALAAMFGGGGRNGGGGQQQQQSAAMTLSHDPRTNHIIVSANETLFLEVKTIVEDIDNAAREARRTVQVVQLQYGNPQIVGRTVGSLMPRVTVSGGGGTRTSTTSSSSSGSGSSSGGSGPSPDDFRRMMEFRNQFQGGGAPQPAAPTGGSDSGRSRFGFGGGGNGGGFPGGGGFGGGGFGGRGGGRGGN